MSPNVARKFWSESLTWEHREPGHLCSISALETDGGSSQKPHHEPQMPQAIRDFKGLSKSFKGRQSDAHKFQSNCMEGSGFPLWKHKYGDHLRPFLSSKIPHQQNHKKSNAAVVLFPLLQPLHSQHKLLPPLPPPPPLPPETQTLQSSSTAYCSQHRPEHHNTSL